MSELLIDLLSEVLVEVGSTRGTCLTRISTKRGLRAAFCPNASGCTSLRALVAGSRCGTAGRQAQQGCGQLSAAQWHALGSFAVERDYRQRAAPMATVLAPVTAWAPAAALAATLARSPCRRTS